MVRSYGGLVAREPSFDDIGILQEADLPTDVLDLLIDRGQAAHRSSHYNAL